MNTAVDVVTFMAFIDLMEMGGTLNQRPALDNKLT
jgi:hypothetical protein